MKKADNDIVKDVTNCNDCIFNDLHSGDIPYCQLYEMGRDLPNVDKTGYYLGGEVPKWCPLKKNQVIIKLK